MTVKKQHYATMTKTEMENALGKKTERRTPVDEICDIQKALKPLGFEIKSFNGSRYRLNIELFAPSLFGISTER